jgi:hypothetical protein
VFPDGESRPRTVALFPDDRALEAEAGADIVRVKLTELALRRPRQWGTCWLAYHLYQELGLDKFWAERLLASRNGTRWDLVLQTLVAYRLIDPGSEWRLLREWFGDRRSARRRLRPARRAAQALCLPPSARRAQGGAVRSSHATLAGSL